MNALHAGRMGIHVRRSDLVWVLIGAMAFVGLSLASLLVGPSGATTGPLSSALEVQLPWWVLAIAFYLAGARRLCPTFRAESASR